ncbi:MAG: hypothetical protein KDC80_30120 [Saprospiraceae bacterium]|nr:hypothetical protein [Saprospiraceae bacterium]
MNTQLLGGTLSFCLSKVEGVLLRSLDLIRWFPKRLWRIVNHLGSPFVRIWKNPRELFNLSEHLYWLIELLFYIFDLIGLSEIYETFADIVKFNTRPLNDNEKALVRRFFGDSLNLKRIRIDEFAFGGPKSHDFAYVSFYTINSWGELNEDIFVHELVHVWQYHQLGSVYIPRALRAQFSHEGYDYGGLANLVLAIRTGKKLSDFNLEQQGDIIADYHRILKGKNPRWGGTTREDLWVYEHLIRDLKSSTTEVAA